MHNYARTNKFAAKGEREGESTQEAPQRALHGAPTDRHATAEQQDCVLRFTSNQPTRGPCLKRTDAHICGLYKTLARARTSERCTHTRTHIHAHMHPLPNAQ